MSVEARRLGVRARISALDTWVLALCFAAVAIPAEWIKHVDGYYGFGSVAVSGGSALLFFLAGVIARRQLPANRMWALMMLAGAAIAAEDYFLSNSPVVFTIGALLANVSGPVLMHMALAFPSGRLRSRQDRVIIGLAWVSALILSPSERLLWAGNNVSLVHVVDSPTMTRVSDGLAAAILLVCLLAIGAILTARWLRATPLQRRIQTPIVGVWAVAGWTAAIDQVYTILDDLGSQAQRPDLVHALGLGAPILLPFVYVAAVVGLRLARGELSARVLGLGDGATPEHLEAVLAEALGDPLVRIAPEGTRPDGAGIAGTPIRDPAAPALVLWHDAALDDDPQLLSAAADAAAAGLARTRAAAEASSRAAQAAETERRRLERNLHDGAQQQLVGLSMELAAARQSLEGTVHPDVLRLLERIRVGLAEATAELRTLAAGAYPAALVEGGLDAGLEVLLDRFPDRVVLSGEVGRRLDTAQEATAYFVAAEAVTNAAKHSGGREIAVCVRLHGSDRLELEVSDDGIGGADPNGSGLRGLRDRVVARGGSLTVSDRAEGGTVVRAELPLALAAVA